MSRAEYIRKLTTVAILLLILITSVAKVAMYGKVYGQAPGTATITITAEGD